MVIEISCNLPQYLRKDDIYVSILKIKSPAHFTVKESPDINTSSSAKKFVEAEEMMQKYYNSVEGEFFQLPLKDSIVVVLHNKKYYRAQVRSILNVAQGHLIKVYLLDYGEECNVPRQCLFTIHQDFLLCPFQALEFKLLDVEPISLVLKSSDLTLDYGPVSSWDVSAMAFIEEMQKVMNSAHIKIIGIGENFVCGSLYLTFNNQEVKCINEQLILKKFARPTEDFWDGVIPIDTYLSKNNLSHTVGPTDIACEDVDDQPTENLSNKSIRNTESLTVADSPKVTALSPSSQNKSNTPINSLAKLKMLKKKSPGGLSNSMSVSPSVDNTKNIVSSGDTMENVTLNETKMIPEEDKSINGTPTRVKTSGQNPLQKLKNLKKASPSPQKASTPLTNQTEAETSSTSLLSPVVQTTHGRFSGSVIDGISPITGIKSDAQSPGSDLSAVKEETNSLNTAFRDSIQPKDVQTLSELSIKEMENSNSLKEKSPPKSSAVKFHNLKNLFKKRNSLPAKPENISANLKPEASPKSASSINGSDSETSFSKFENSLNEGFSDLDETGDLLQCILDPKNNTAIDSSTLSSPDGSRKSSLSNDSFVEMNSLNDIDFTDKSLWEIQKVPALCIGEAVPSPVLSTGESSFPPALLKTLEYLKFRGPSCIQSVVWPAVERRRCLAAVGPPHSGKTVAYMLPIVANFMSSLTHAELPKTHGPIVIIICSSWRKVQAVYDLFKTFLNGAQCKILTFFADGRSKKNRVAALLNGCDVLISVPYCLLDFFENGVLDVKRCCHFILDDGSTLLSHNMKELKAIMRHFARSIELRTSIPVSLQVLICAERWTKGVASFVNKFLPLPLLLFTSFLEAAVYAKVPIYAHVCDAEDKKKKLLGILDKSGKTIICTNSSSTAFEIHDFLKCENVRSFLINENMEHYISDGVIQDWKSVRSTSVPHCLVVTDTAFTHMNISCANFLIHYDIPEISRLQFGNRFSCIAEHFTNLNEGQKCVCHILVSEDCVLQAPSLLKLIGRSDVKVCPELKELAKKQVIVKKPIEIPICHFMKAFGSCKVPNCQQRHHIDPTADQPRVVPSEGDVHVLVVHICDATHFYVRLLKYLTPGVAQPSSLSGTYAKIGFQLKKFYLVEENRRKAVDPVVGRDYVLQEENLLFYRVKVLDIIPATEAQRKKIKLLFRDEGWVQVSDNFQLLEYVEGPFPPPLVVEVYLCGVRTPDSCPDWNPQSSRFMSSLVKGKEIHGKIVLCLGETLWLHPVAIREKLKFTDDYLNVVSLDKSLKDAEFAIENKNHLPLLIKACGKDIPLPKEIKIPTPIITTEVEETVQYSYAFLELNIYEDVYVSNVISPHEFYVQREKFVDCLDVLSDKIQEKINGNTLEKCKALQNGMHCIALFEEDMRYYRAKITEVMSDSDAAQVFFEDFGDFGCVAKDHTFTLPAEFSLLPFQAIKCELNGICAPHGGWTDKAGNALYNLTRNEDGDMKILQMMAYKKSDRFGVGNHYVVDLWNLDKSVSEQLLETGLVSPSEKLAPVEDIPAEETWQDMFEDVPDGYVASSDEDLDEESKAIHVRFLTEVAKMMYGPPPEQPKPPSEEKVTEDATPKRMEKIVEEEEITLPVKRSPFLSMQRLMNLKKNEPKRAKPFITWWNTEVNVNILINLRNIEIYELDVKEDRFTFRTSLRGMDYHTEENFYGNVHSEEAVVNTTIQGLNIVLKKQVPEQWPRLTKEKFSHIKYDMDHIEDSDSEEATKEKPLEENQNPDESMVAHFDSEEDNSSDDDDDYVQPWKKLAQYKDPFNPFD